ncbi:MAG: hypothetical protein JWM11_1006, partial [Planctomycetaceae bacterium]|nr:hypothetical protein [Planctomycetaceae bacterium]
MRRNDFTPDEARIGRLIQSLGHSAPAPDAEFLKRLRESTTAVFLDAQRQNVGKVQVSAPSAAVESAVESRVQASALHEISDSLSAPQQVVSASNSVLGHSAAEGTVADRSLSRNVTIPSGSDTSRHGRNRLQRLRTVMLIVTAILLAVGFLPDSLVPSRGARLEVAFDNLARASSAEFEVRNGDSSSVMLMAQGDNGRSWMVLYPSENAEVFDGVNSYFFNAKSNSLHFMAPEDSAEQARPDEKLLDRLNVVDESVRVGIKRQRPQAIINDHGHSLFVYTYNQSSFDNTGTVNVEARVDARTNELVAMNTVFRDNSGQVKFQAGANVRSMNRAFSTETFQVTPEEISEDVATVEEVQGNPVVDQRLELAMNQNVSLNDGTFLNRTNGDSGIGNANWGDGGLGGFGGGLNGGPNAKSPPFGAQPLRFGGQFLGLSTPAGAAETSDVQHPIQPGETPSAAVTAVEAKPKLLAAKSNSDGLAGSPEAALPPLVSAPEGPSEQKKESNSKTGIAMSAKVGISKPATLAET